MATRGSSHFLPRSLGWASLALAGPPLTAPRAFCAAIGVGTGRKQQSTARWAVGVRELAAGVLLLTRPNSVWLWGRVGGDVLDLAMLTRALRHHDGVGIRRTVAATAAVAGITAVDVYAAAALSSQESRMQLSATTTINKPPGEVYAFWRQLENLPTFMAHVDEVRTTGNGSSHWRVSAPFGRRVEWDAETTEERPGERIAWRSVDGSEVSNRGEVEFRAAPGGRGAEVHVSLSYEAPGGKLGEALARYFGEDPRQQLDDDLRRLKQVLEVGEVVRSDGAPGGKRARREFPQRPAQPLTEKEYTAEVEQA